MASVTRISPEHRALEAPLFLRELPGWLLWKYEHHSGEAKPRKTPYYTTGGRRYGKQGSPADRAKLTAFAAARDAAARRGMDGVGFALMPDWNITALDFDNCVAPDGSIPDEIMEIAAATYSEYSPSGHGIRAFVKGQLGNRKDRGPEGGYGFETFSSTGFVTLSANRLPIVEIMGFENHIADASDALLKLCEARFGSIVAKAQPDADDPFAGHEPRLGLSPEDIEETLKKLDPGLGRDEWIKVGMALHHECEGDDTGFDLWNEWSCVADNYVSEEDLRKDWDSFDRRQGSIGRQITFRYVLKLIRDLTPAADPADLKHVIDEAARHADPATVNTPDGYEGKFPILTAAALASAPPIDWLIKGIVPRADILMMFGSSTAGKSFVSLDMAAAIARGIEWRGRKVRKGRVLIVAAEGSGGMGKRIDAYCRQHMIDVDDLEIGLIIVPPNFMEKGDIEELARSIATAGGFDLIIVDTYAQVTPGANENSGEDMGLALANARALREATGATIMLIHHAGKDPTKGARGWSGNRAAVDAEIEIIRDEESDRRQIHISKMKDGEDGLRFGFTLEVIQLGVDADGDAVTSCVVRECDMPSARIEDKSTRSLIDRLGPIERAVVEAAEQGFKAVEKVGYDVFVNATVERLPAPEPRSRDTRKQRIARALASLSQGKQALFSVQNGYVYFYMD